MNFYNKKLEIKNLSKNFEKKEILKNINISINNGEIVSVLGYSGVGKTTLFNLISGLIFPDCGEIILDGKNINGKSGKVSYMLQKDLLLPYRTIIENISLPLIIKGIKKKDAEQKVKNHIATFGLSGYEDKYPHELSGGMKQKVAFLRTYMFTNDVILLDEPFSALDTMTKNTLHNWYLDIVKKMNLSTLFITHDIDEAIFLSDKIYILDGQPGMIKKEIIIKKEKIKKEEFTLSLNFLDYKKQILEIIKNNC